jgi:YHS domain-containing protein
MKARWIVLSLSVAMLLAAGELLAAKNESPEKKFEATCPVSGKPAIETSVVELKDGDKVYFCCQNCPKAFKANPKKFELQVDRQLLETGQIVQVACPVSGKPVNKETMVEVGHGKAGFCCKNCLAKYNAADYEGKLKIMFADLKKGFTHQTMCPVSGKPINPLASVEYKGEKVYFCCENCPNAFKANPEKFLAKLPQFAKDKGDASRN